MRFLFFPLYLFASILTIQIDNIKNTKGYIYITIYKNPDNFLYTNKAFKNIVLKSKKAIKYKISLKNGIYAISVFHDENNNGVLDKNFFHFPKEGYGFSNNPFLLGKPSFEDAQFLLNKNENIEIEMKY